MKLIKTFKERKYFKYTHIGYSSGNAGGMYHYWDEYQAGAHCAEHFPWTPVILTSIVIQIGSWTNEFHEGYVDDIWVDGSNDGGVTWTPIKGFGNRQGCDSWHTLDCSENTRPYTKFRFFAKNRGWAYNDALSIKSVEYRGYYISATEGTSSSYDWYVDTFDCNAPYLDNTYKAFNI